MTPLAQYPVSSGGNRGCCLGKHVSLGPCFPPQHTEWIGEAKGCVAALLAALYGPVVPEFMQTLLNLLVASPVFCSSRFQTSVKKRFLLSVDLTVARCASSFFCMGIW